MEWFLFALLLAACGVIFLLIVVRTPTGVTVTIDRLFEDAEYAPLMGSQQLRSGEWYTFVYVVKNPAYVIGLKTDAPVPLRFRIARSEGKSTLVEIPVRA